MVQVADTDTVLTLGSAGQLRSLGYAGVIRYVGRAGGLSAGEVADIRAAGLDVASVYETSGHSGTGGYALGQAEARSAIDGHRSAGGPPGVILWTGAFDFDCLDPGAAQPYIDGYTSVCHAEGFSSGIYGSGGLSQHTQGWDAWWQTCSTGFWNNATTLATSTLRQYCNGPWYDSNDINRQPWGGWLTPPPPPAPPDDYLELLL